MIKYIEIIYNESAFQQYKGKKDHVKFDGINSAMNKLFMVRDYILTKNCLQIFFSLNCCDVSFCPSDFWFIPLESQIIEFYCIVNRLSSKSYSDAKKVLPIWQSLLQKQTSERCQISDYNNTNIDHITLISTPVCSAVNSSPDDVFKHIMIMKIRRRNTTKKRIFFLIICRPSYITSSRSRESLRRFHIIFILLHALSLSLSLSL